jgi:hypothetical protein
MSAGDTSYLCETSSRTRRSPRPYLAVGSEAFYHHLPLILLIPKVPEESFLILANPLQASLYPTLQVPLVESQTEVEEFSVVAVVETDSCPARETLSPSIIRVLRILVDGPPCADVQRSPGPRRLSTRTWLNGPLSRARRGEALRRKSSILYLQMEPLFAPISLWAAF